MVSQQTKQTKHIYILKVIEVLFIKNEQLGRMAISRWYYSTN